MEALAVICLAAELELPSTLDGWRAGAREYVMKLEPAQDVLAAIRTVLAGQLHDCRARPSNGHPAESFAGD
jgi:DNA-binding NarL/FixJ family response regulator